MGKVLARIKSLENKLAAEFGHNKSVTQIAPGITEHGRPAGEPSMLEKMMKDKEEREAAVPYNKDAMLENFRLGMFTNGVYSSAAKKVKQALEENKKMTFFVKDTTGFGGILWVKVDGEAMQLSKKKLRQSDLEGMLNGY